MSGSPAPVEHRLCHCDLSGDHYIVTPTTCCEVCPYDKTIPFTPENVRGVLEEYRGRIETLSKEIMGEL